jgi:arginase
MMNELSSEQIAEFRRVFDLFDSDADGRLTRGEIHDALEVLGRSISKADADRLLASLDADDNVRPDAFIAWMAAREDLDLKADLRCVFDLLDTDRSGTLSADELSLFIRGISSAPSEIDVDRVIKLADKSGNGILELSEFVSNPALWSEARITLGAVRSFKKILIQYAKIARSRSISLVEVDSEIGAGTRGASLGIGAIKTAALRKQASRRERDNGILSIDPLRVQTENNALFRTQKHPHAKYIDRLEQVLIRTRDVVAEALLRRSFPIVLGGDHSTAAGTIAGIKKAFPDRRLGVVWIDAHADIHSPFTTPSGNMHGMPVAIASGIDNLAKQINAPCDDTMQHWRRVKELVAQEPNIRLEDLVYVSVRDTEDAEDFMIETVPILNYRTEKVRELGAEQVAKSCLDRLAGVDLIYVSFDVDSMDSAISMGTGTPVPNGLSVEEARRINELLCADPRVCCWEMCEINPVLDTLNTMAENSLGIFEAVVDAITDRLEAPSTRSTRAISPA